jgi:hypothetical protein
MTLMIYKPGLPGSPLRVARSTPLPSVSRTQVISSGVLHRFLCLHPTSSKEEPTERSKRHDCLYHPSLRLPDAVILTTLFGSTV